MSTPRTHLHLPFFSFDPQLLTYPVRTESIHPTVVPKTLHHISRAKKMASTLSSPTPYLTAAGVMFELFSLYSMEALFLQLRGGVAVHSTFRSSIHIIIMMWSTHPYYAQSIIHALIDNINTLSSLSLPSPPLPSSPLIRLQQGRYCVALGVHVSHPHRNSSSLRSQ